MDARRWQPVAVRARWAMGWVLRGLVLPCVVWAAAAVAYAAEDRVAELEAEFPRLMRQRAAVMAMIERHEAEMAASRRTIEKAEELARASRARGYAKGEAAALAARARAEGALARLKQLVEEARKSQKAIESVYFKAKAEYTGLMKTREPLLPGPPRDPALVEAERLIRQMKELAVKMGWPPDECKRVAMALDRLGALELKETPRARIEALWRACDARRGDAALLEALARAGGAGPVGRGRQTVHNDCVLFAVSQASGVPYGLVSNRAAEIVRRAEWRGAADRKDPSAALTRGLNGGELVLLVESLGRAEVVKSAAFAKVLEDGKPVLVNVTPPGGEGGGHQVVLTKTFRHGGKTWFVMRESNRGLDELVFLQAEELESLLGEAGGIVFRSDPGRTPTLLRTR